MVRERAFTRTKSSAPSLFKSPATSAVDALASEGMFTSGEGVSKYTLDEGFKEAVPNAWPVVVSTKETDPLGPGGSALDTVAVRSKALGLAGFETY
jgi:hypothetical protein